MSFDAVVFYVLAAVTLVTAVLVITRRNPVHSAVWLVATFVSVAAIYISLGAQFLGAVQMLVYAGGIMILYVFVVMLVRLEPEELAQKLYHRQSLLAWIVCLALLIFVGFGMGSALQLEGGGNYPETVSEMGGHTEAVGAKLYTDFIYPFEVVSILLLVAALGVIVLTRRDWGDKSEESTSAPD